MNIFVTGGPAFSGRRFEITEANNVLREDVVDLNFGRPRLIKSFLQHLEF